MSAWPIIAATITQNQEIPVTGAILLIALALVVMVCLIWRYALWPCPAWLSPLLENPYLESVAGAPMLLERAGVRQGMRVLDAGCGPGRLTLLAASGVGPSGGVVALDIQPKMLKRLQMRLSTSGLHNVQLLLAGLGDGQLPVNAFDVALLVTVLGEVPDKLAALRELGRSLRPGGVLSITEVLPDPHYQPLSRVRWLAAAVGFREQSLYRGFLAYTVNFVKESAATGG